MNIIALVGHHASGYLQVESLLKEHGMAAALPSRRDDLSVSGIQAALCKAHNIRPTDPLEPSTRENPIELIQPAPLWQNLALDLLLANLDQPLWGWADPQTLYLLDYWRQLDANINFLLVYQDPQQALEQALRGNADTQAAAILDDWTAYHEVLLRYFLRHPERSFLAHSQRLLQHPQDSLSHLPYLQINAENNPNSRSLTDRRGHYEEPNPQSIPLATYLHQQLTQNHAAQALYDELESVANLPLQKTSAPTSPETAWKSLHQQSRALAKITQSQEEQPQQNEEQLKQKLTETEEENELLLLQLHQVQEELERVFLENTGEIEAKQHPSIQGPYYGAAERQKNHLAYRLGSAIIDVHNNKGRLGYIKVPFALIRELIAFRKEKAKRSNEKLPPISQYADAHEAQEVKMRLPYRLGKITMKYGKSPLGWLKLPSALNQEAEAFRKERGKRY